MLEADEVQADVSQHPGQHACRGALSNSYRPSSQFLFLRQLGQGASSLRVSDPLSIENNESSVNLLSISNVHGVFFAATNEGQSRELRAATWRMAEVLAVPRSSSRVHRTSAS